MPFQWQLCCKPPRMQLEMILGSAFADLHTQGVCIDTPGDGVVSTTWKLVPPQIRQVGEGLTQQQELR
jgi:hypothetical protein